MLKIALSFDYDSPLGYRHSFNSQDLPLDADKKGADVILEILRKHNVRVTFGVVAHAALKEDPPEFCRDQISLICHAGHEIASHSLTHRYLPAMSNEEMLHEIQESKKILESCTKEPVRGFIPPFNRPMHFPARGAFSFEEVFGLNGHGRGRQSIESLSKGLQQFQYGWCRVSFQSKWNQFLKFVRGSDKKIPLTQPFLLNGIAILPCHAVGFGEWACSLVEKSLGKNNILMLSAHPNQAHANNDENADRLYTFLGRFRKEREHKALDFFTMRDIESAVRVKEGFRI